MKFLTPFLVSTSAALLLGAGAPDLLASASNAAESACMQAVNSNYGGNLRNLDIVSSEFSQANSEVIMNADGQTWRCLVSEQGDVRELTVVEGSSRNSGNSGPAEWDRGCEDAKVGSYDRSQHSDAYEEGWQACNDQQKQSSGNSGSSYSGSGGGGFDMSGRTSGHCKLSNVDVGREIYNGRCSIKESSNKNSSRIFEIKMGSADPYLFATSDGRTWMSGPEEVRFEDRGHTGIFRWSDFRLEVDQD